MQSVAELSRHRMWQRLAIHSSDPDERIYLDYACRRAPAASITCMDSYSTIGRGETVLLDIDIRFPSDRSSEIPACSEVLAPSVKEIFSHLTGFA